MNELVRLGSGFSSLLVALVLGASRATAQDALYDVPGGPETAQLMGAHILPVGDFDGDGWRDFYSASASGFGNSDRLIAVSGKNSKKLFEKNMKLQWFLGVDHFVMVSDHDGDGFNEFLQLGDTACYLGPGSAVLRSGADGSVIWQVCGGESGFGAGGCEVDDHDGDGIPEIVIGEQWTGDPSDPNGQSQAGTLHVLSGISGLLIKKIHAPSFGDATVHAGLGFGDGVFDVGDQDGDGYVDVLAVPKYPTTKDSAGQTIKAPVCVFSVISGSLIGTIAAVEPISMVLAHAARIQDLNGDGLDEFILGNPNSSPAFQGSGRVALIEGGTLDVLAEWFGQETFERHGSIVRATTDYDGDGIPDVLAGSTLAFDGDPVDVEGVVRAYGSVSDELLFEIYPPDKPSVFQDGFGQALGELGDLNGDGIPEIAIGVPEYRPFLQSNIPEGRVYVYSTADLALDGQPPWVQSASGGSQALELDFGREHAGQLYLVAGSFAGIWPGVSLPGVLVPIVPDAYTTFMLTSGGGPLVGSAFFGLLDGAGQASLTATVPGGVGAVAGLTAWHVAIVLGPTGAVLEASNAAALSFVP